MFGLGIELSRTDYNEYKWWEFELRLTFVVWYITVTVNHNV